MPRLVVFTIVGAMSAVLCSCASAPVPTVTVTTTVTQTTMADPDSSNTPPSPDSSPAPSGNLGLVWASTVDSGRVNQPTSEQPRFDGGKKLATRIDMILYVESAAEGEISEGCADEIESSGKSSDTHCLMVQFAMDVPFSYRADEAGLAPGPLLNPDGRQIDKATVTDGVPGAKHVTISEFYAGGKPGSTLRWEIGSNEQDWKTLKYQVPKLDAFKPINFS